MTPWQSSLQPNHDNHDNGCSVVLHGHDTQSLTQWWEHTLRVSRRHLRERKLLNGIFTLCILHVILLRLSNKKTKMVWHIVRKKNV